MVFSSNILSTEPSSWTITNGSALSESIRLQAGGVAKQTITQDKLNSVPNSMRVTLLADPYTNAYAGNIFMVINVTSTSEEVYRYHIPVVLVSKGICTFDIALTATDYVEMTVELHSAVTCTFSDWALLAPRQSDVDLTEILDQLPRLLNDYNVRPVSVGQMETAVAMINSYITDDTELTGMLNIKYTASDDCLITLRIKDNETSELFTPCLYFVDAGEGTLGVPHGYLIKKKGYHNFTVTLQASAGTVTILPRDILYIIDGGKIAYNISDIGAVAEDLSVKYLRLDSSPSAVYAACLDDEQATLKQRPITDAPGAGWAQVGAFGPAVSAAVEFDGEWDLTVNPYQFYTTEEPFFFWVTPEGSLLHQALPSENILSLATDVVSVSAIKGWRNAYNPGTDQGLVVVYIKTDGQVYYRNYCEQVNLSFFWEAERLFDMFVGTAVKVNTFRTTDYRIGINILDDASVTHTFITKRVWPGTSTPPEKLHATIKDIIFKPTEVTYYREEHIEHLEASITDVVFAPRYTLPDNRILTIGNIDNGEGDWGHYVEVTLRYGLTNETLSDFTLVDANDTPYMCLSIEHLVGTTYRFQFINFNNSSIEDTPVAFKCAAISTTNEAGLLLDPFEISFYPQNLVPVFIPLPEPEEIWNE